MAYFQEDGDRKLQIFAYLHVGVTLLVSLLVFTHGTASFTEIINLHVSGTLTLYKQCVHLRETNTCQRIARVLLKLLRTTQSCCPFISAKNAINPLPANFYYCAIDRNDEIINSNLTGTHERLCSHISVFE